jgi:hypothetical protein
MLTTDTLADGNFCGPLETQRRLDYLDHFLRLARRGAHGGASGGEQRAHRLAAAIEADAAGLDGKAVAGLIEFVRVAAGKPWLAGELLEAE